MYSSEEFKEAQTAIAKLEYSFWNRITTHGIWQPARHTELICQKIEAIERGELKRVIFSLPPRHSKSMSITESAPAWFICKKPARRVMVICYGDALARKFGRRNLNKMKHFAADLFGIQLADDNSSVSDWGLQDHRGGLLSTGIGGAITGEGADLMIIDDPIKNREEADSLTYRDKIWDEYENTLRTRLTPNGTIIVIATRWHEDDLTGRLLRHEPGVWHEVKLPCEAEENDILGRQIGEPLWPDFGFDKEWIEEFKKTIGIRVWASLFQQRPAPQEGTIFKRAWFGNFYDEWPEFESIVQSWDMSFKKSSDTSYVVGQAWGVVKARRYLLHQVRRQMGFSETVAEVRNMKSQFPSTRHIFVEDKANGPAVMDMLGRELPGLIPVEPRGSKEARAAATTHYWEAGNVFLPRPEKASWVPAFIEEHCSFPSGAADDQVDATSQALDQLGKRGITRPSDIKVGRNKMMQGFNY